MKPSGRTAATAGMRLTLLLTIAALAGAGADPDPAQAYVPPEQAMAAAERGADWFRGEQLETGALPGDWGMTALAAVGANAADVRTALSTPSAQDYYHDDWEVNGPGGAATDASRAILAGHAGGIQTSRISATRNMIAEIAEAFDGTQVGSPGLLNDDIFAILALAHEKAPDELLEQIAGHVREHQLDDGGWGWSGSATSADTDVTGAGIAALCAAGAGPSDPAVEAALDHLRSVQDPEKGGFASPPWTPVNTNSTGWVASGLVQCGIDPQGIEWTTPEGETPFDFLLSVQQADGRFCWDDPENCMGSAAYATWDAVRPLAGTAFSAEPPPREDGTSPAVRPAPDVPDGATVPITLVIDHGDEGEVTMCRADVPNDADLEATLAAAEEDSEPIGCVADHATAAGAGDGVVLEQLNGIAASGEGSWWVRIDGGDASTEVSESIGYGDLVFLRFGGDGDDPPPVDPPDGETRTPTVKVTKPWWLRLSRGGVSPRLRCVHGGSERGCRGTLRLRRAGKPVGRAHYRIGAGNGRRVRVRVARPVRRLVRRHGTRQVRIVAATRSLEGAVRVTRAKRRVVAR